MLHDFAWVENTIGQFRSLKSRLSSSAVARERRISATDLDGFVLSLMREKEVPIFGAANGPLGQAVADMFAKDARMPMPTSMRRETPEPQKCLPPALSKEYVLKWIVPRPALSSRPVPQRLYAKIHPSKEFRLAGAFSQDVTFF